MIRMAAVIFALLMWSAHTVIAAEPARPDKRTPDCTSGGCHAKQLDFKVRHGPVQIGSCESCHVYDNEKQHAFRLRSEKRELCTFCHIGGGGPPGKVAHKPFADGECLTCHNPHGGANRVMLRTEDLAALCESCHGDTKRNRKFLHGPVTTGSCAACHNSHRSSSPHLLTMDVRDLCMSCHEKMESQIKNAKVLHKPIEQDCRQCHEVHASDHLKHLKQDPVKLCASCHENVMTQVVAEFKHSPATTGEACLSCHTSHGSDLAKLMKDEPSKTCLSCHDKPIELPGGRIVATMESVADEKQFKHGPLRENDCSGCHVSHGSANAHLLAKPYSPDFYQPFTLEKYELCFSCHDKELVTLEKTEGLTGFRNGDRNLHYLHVNKPDKGRNCRSCHQTHTSSLPMHLRETVPFGKWELPIGFSQSENGGSCKSACHEEYGYDRNRPVKNEVKKP